MIPHALAQGDPIALAIFIFGFTAGWHLRGRLVRYSLGGRP